MTLNIIGGDIVHLNNGERKVLEKLRTLYKNNNGILYVQPLIKNLEPDFILIDPLKGVCIIEVKGWSIDYIEKINKKEVKTNDGKTLENPCLKARRYFNLIKGLFESNDDLLDDNGELRFRISTRVIFTAISSEDIKNNGLEEFLNQPCVRYITSEKLKNLNINDLFGEVVCPLSSDIINIIRTVIFPELKINEINKKSNDINEIKKIIHALDYEQEKFARKIPYGHYMVSGVPGSGKTVMLIARALHLAKELSKINKDCKILILTYNRSLKRKLESRINKFSNELRFMDIPLQNIEIKTFHRFAMDILYIPYAPEGVDSEWWNEIMPKMALEKAKPMYDAILIDEYQDFYDDWIRLCIKSCKEYIYKNKKYQNIFLAGDRLQSIYNPKEHSWKSLGLNIVGRSKLLKTTYRTGKSHIIFALHFLMKDSSLKKEVEKFYEWKNDIENPTNIDSKIGFIEGDYSKINDVLKDLIYRLDFEPDDVLILVPSKDIGKKLLSNLDENLKSMSIYTKDIMDGKINITTYHSSKGLEAQIIILVDVNKINNRKLLYVGMTRASYILYIHSNNFNEGFAKELKEIYKNIFSYGSKEESY